MNLDWIADPTAESVLDLLAQDEPMTADEREAAARGRRSRTRRELQQLTGVLRSDEWDQHTTGVALVRLLAQLVDDAEASPTALREFVDQTFDARKNAFRPHRVSQYVRARHGVGITNHTAKKMLGLLAEAGRRHTGRSAEGASSVGGRSDRSTSISSSRSQGRDKPLPRPWLYPRPRGSRPSRVTAVRGSRSWQR